MASGATKSKQTKHKFITAGTQGYDRAVDDFIEHCQALNFQALYQDFMSYLPEVGAKILDLGSGAGQNAAALCEMGYQVTAVDPMPKFMAAAKKKYNRLNINWLISSLPHLEALDSQNTEFDFILLCGVWHHLAPQEQIQAISVLAKLLKRSGKCALTLRHGPAGLGTCVYATDIKQLISDAAKFGLTPLFRQEGKPSMLANKAEVTWDHLVLEKQ